MPSSDVNELKKLIESLNDETNNDNSLVILKQIKSSVLRFTIEDINAVFFEDKENLNKLFLYTFKETASVEPSLVSDVDILRLNESFDVFEKILDSFQSLSQVFIMFNQELIYVFTSQSLENFQLLCLRTLNKLMKKWILNDDTQTDKEMHDETELKSIETYLNAILPYLIKQIPVLTPKYNELFIEFVLYLSDAENLNGFSLIFNNDQVKKLLFNVLNTNKTQFYRVFELFIRLSSKSDRYLAECNKCFNLDKLIQIELSNKNDDILSKLNCIELLKHLAETKQGYEYLSNNGHLKNLALYLSHDCEIDILSASLLIPGIVKLFGSSAYRHPVNVFNQYPEFYQYLLNTVLDDNYNNNDSKANICLSIDTLAHIFENNEAKSILIENYKEVLLQKIFKRLLYFIQYAINELRIKSIYCFSSLISSNLKSNIILNSLSMDYVSSLTYNLFECFIKETTSEKFFNLLLNYAKQPFMEIRLATQSCFNAFVQTKWGSEYLLKNSNKSEFLKYLLDRSTELEKEGRMSKYELVKSVSNSEFIHELIDAAQFKLIEIYIREGPYYIQREVAVEFQSA